MSNIVPFESAKLPAYLKSVDVAAINKDLLAHAGTGFPVISIKGKVFSVVRDGERSILPNPKDPDSPATSIDVVIIKANAAKSKVFYAKGFDEKSENQKPDCFSNDGVKPDASVDKPQFNNCATCPKAQWGSKISENGKKVKACSDSVKLAVATVDMINDPYLLRVPAASMSGLGEYGQMLAKRGVGYPMMLTKIGFDQAEATPKLTYKPVGFLDEAAYKAVAEMAESDVVRNILGSSIGAVHEPEAAAAPAVPAEVETKAAAVISKAKTVTNDEVAAAVAAPKAKTKVETPPVAEEEADLDLDGLSFDD